MRRLAAAVVVTLALGLRYAGAQDPPASVVLDDAWVRAAVSRVVPAVERACGRSFVRPPEVGIADAGDVMRSLRDDLEPATAAFFAGQPRARIQRALQLRADLLASGVLGKYGLATQEVYLVPQAAALNLGIVGHQDLPLPSAMLLVLVHELVHALQDQECDLRARTRALTDVDAAEAFAMLIEGHAVFCSERAAEELGLLAAIGPLRAVFAGRHDVTKTPTADLTSRRLRGSGDLQYLRAAEYIAGEHQAGGNERLWQLLKSPAPRTRTMLVPHGVAVASCEPRPEVFASIDATLAGPTWTIGRGGLADTRLLAENLPRGTDVVALLPRLLQASEWFAVAPTPLSWRALYALTFADAEAAAEFVALVEDVATKDMQNRDAAFTKDPFDAWQGASGRRLAQRATKAAPLAGAADLILVREGCHVLQATWVNAPVANDALLDVARRVLAAMAKPR